MHRKLEPLAETRNQRTVIKLRSASLLRMSQGDDP